VTNIALNTWRRVGFVLLRRGAGYGNSNPSFARRGQARAIFGRVIQASRSDEDRDFNVALEGSLSFKRAPSGAVAAIAVTSDPNAPRVMSSEEDIRRNYPWDYRELVRRLWNRYSDFKATRSSTVFGIGRPLISGK